MNATSIAAIVAAAIILLMLFYFRNKLSAFLKDSSTIPDPSQRTYSLAKTILAFWTFIILFSICYIAIACGYLPPLTQNVLILMGIAVGTTVMGLIVAILAMVFYTTLKYRVVKTLSEVEVEALSLSTLMEHGKD